mgnify:FL=1
MIFIYIMLALIVAVIVGLGVWYILKCAESDAIYEADIDAIYGRK